MSTIIKKLTKNNEEIKNVKNFLFMQIKEEYGYGYIPEYHQDIKYLEEFYINPKRNAFFIVKDCDSQEIIGTIAIREYDKEFKEFENIYSKKSTASIWRLFIAKEHRRKKIATKLVKIVEDFSILNKYEEIYLHTHKTCQGALEFWKNTGYEVTLDTNNELQTVHMIKNIDNTNLKIDLNNLKIPIKS